MSGYIHFCTYWYQIIGTNFGESTRALLCPGASRSPLPQSRPLRTPPSFTHFLARVTGAASPQTHTHPHTHTLKAPTNPQPSTQNPTPKPNSQPPTHLQPEVLRECFVEELREMASGLGVEFPSAIAGRLEALKGI